MNLAIGVLGTEKRQAINVNIKEWKGKIYVDIRTHYTGSDGQWYPTQKGLFVSKDKISELITLLEKAEAQLRQAEPIPI